MKPERGHPQLRGQPSRPGNLELRYDTDPDVDAPSAGQAPEVGDPVPTQLAKPSHGHIPWLALRTPPSHADDSRAPPSLHTKEITSAPPVDQLYLSTAGEQAIPPLSYQPLRAYHLPRNGSSPQVYHPAEGDQWTQPGSAPPSRDTTTRRTVAGSATGSGSSRRTRCGAPAGRCADRGRGPPVRHGTRG